VGTGGSTGPGGSTGSGGTSGLGGSGTGGSVGTGGSTSTGGSSGSCAATPAAGTPPQLTCCTEYSHEANDNCGANAYVDSVAFSRDGTLLATGGADANVKIWSFDGKTLTPVTTLPLPHTSYLDAYGFLAFSPDGRYLAAGGGGAVEVYNVSNWTPASAPLAISGTALGIGFAPDSQHVVSVDADTLYVHVIGTPTAVATAALADYVDTLSVSPVAGPGGATTIVVGGETIDFTGEAEIFSFAGSTLNGPVLLDLSASTTYYDDPIYSSAFTADGASLALGDYVSEVWLTGVPSASRTLTTPSLVVDSTNYPDVRALAYSPANANYLAVGSGITLAGDYGVLSIWDLSSRAPYASYTGVNATPQSIAFSPSGNAIVLGEAGCGRVLLCTN
jgi:WD40 repeat protein